MTPREAHLRAAYEFTDRAEQAVVAGDDETADEALRAAADALGRSDP
jgi:hypothetical protein